MRLDTGGPLGAAAKAEGYMAEGKSEEEVTKERGARYAEAQEDRIEQSPAAQEDEDGIFTRGKYEVVSKEGFSDVRLGMIPLEKINLDAANMPEGRRHGQLWDHFGEKDPAYRPDHDPLYLWQRANGELVVIDGHNRLLRAKLAGAESINAYVFTETAERTEQWARAKYYEKNVREHKASVKEVAWFVSGANIHGRQLTAEELAEYGLNEEQSNKVRIGIMLGRYGAPEVLEAGWHELVAAADWQYEDYVGVRVTGARGCRIMCLQG